MSKPEKKTPKAWTEFLSLENTEVTLEEYIAGCHSRALGALVEAAQALGHVEGMVGAIDEFMYRAYPDSYAGSTKIRKALAEQRSHELKALMESMEDTNAPDP